MVIEGQVVVVLEAAALVVAVAVAVGRTVDQIKGGGICRRTVDRIKGGGIRRHLCSLLALQTEAILIMLTGEEVALQQPTKRAT
jgi:hypothetical protein